MIKPFHPIMSSSTDGLSVTLDTQQSRLDRRGCGTKTKLIVYTSKNHPRLKGLDEKHTLFDRMLQTVEWIKQQI